MDRRDFLKYLASFIVINLFPLGLNGWAAGIENRLPKDGWNKRRKKLIVLFQRGAVDGLSVVVPYGEGEYYDARPTIAIPSVGRSGGVLDLNGYFGLHPSLASIFPLWKNKSLAFVHACGSPDTTRSHFEAQNHLECGNFENPRVSDGWMNRLLSVLPGPYTPMQAVSLGPVLPQILQGKMNATTVPIGGAASFEKPLDRPFIEGAFNDLYRGNDPLSQAYMEGQKNRKQILVNLEKHMSMADQGAPSPNQFSNNVKRLAQLMVEDPSIQLAFLDLGGWDTHVNQGAVQGQLADHLKLFAEGLRSLVNGLGEVYNDTVIIVISEFGRTVGENGNGGTDHGHGNVLWVLGGGVNGGTIAGQWPGLSADELFEGRDLAVTTDFRQIVVPLITKHFQLSVEQLQIVFPQAPRGKEIILLS